MGTNADSLTSDIGNATLADTGTVPRTGGPTFALTQPQTIKSSQMSTWDSKFDTDKRITIEVLVLDQVKADPARKLRLNSIL